MAALKYRLGTTEPQDTCLPTAGAGADGRKAWFRSIGLGFALLVAVGANAGCTGDSSGTGDVGGDSLPSAEQESSSTTRAAAVDTTTTTVGASDADDDFIPISLQGSGSGVEILPNPLAPATLVRITHEGGGDVFSVVAETAEGERIEELVYRFGQYDGRVLSGLGSGDEAEVLVIRATGAWTIQTEPLTEAILWLDTSTEFSGIGDDVILVATDLPLTIAEISHQGEANFQVYAYGEDARRYTLVNDIGDHNGTYRFTAGSMFVTVTADGPWSIVLQP